MAAAALLTMPMACAIAVIAGSIAIRRITARALAQAERTRESLDAALTECEREARELRAVVGDAGHALKTPLTAIIGFIDVLDGSGCDDPST